MSKCVSYQITGDIIKGVGYKNKQFGIPVELMFENGEKKTYIYTSARKKDVVASLTNGAIASEAMTAQLKDGFVFFTHEFNLN